MIGRLLAPFAAALGLLFAGAAAAQSSYTLLNPPQPTEGGGKVEVIEFFWYGCPHCYHLEPAVNAWLKALPKDVVFKRVPAVPSESWANMASIYYTLEAMGMLDKYHDKVFDAVHKDRLNLGNKKVRDEWLAKQGIDVAKYNDVEKSFAVVTKVQRAKQMTANYKIDSVPQIVVNGKYVVSSETAGGPEKIFAAVDQAVAQARREKTASSAPAVELARR
ncbi:MAG: thiol:disulfide interchange protein DsbA/DsbL [Bacillota bacterium]